MKTTVNQSLNHCGYYVGKPLRVTVNKLGKTWAEPIGWTPKQALWLSVPNTIAQYVGKEFNDLSNRSR